MDFRVRIVSVLLAVFGACALGFGEGTRSWEQSKFDQFSKGTADGVAITSDGGLELAPVFKVLTTTPSTYIWSIAADSAGNIYAATGGPARVYRITPDGKATVIFEPQELQVQALVIDKNGALYAATNPDGKVYRLERRSGPAETTKAAEAKTAPDSSWRSSVYFAPGTKYIWDLILDAVGNLYVATGDHGEIFRVTLKGEHSVFFKSDEAHIRVLALDQAGNLVAGSDGSGLVYRVSPSGEGFVLYSAPKKEITALAVDNSGNIFAAGAGEKRAGAAPFLPTMAVPPTATPQPAPGAAPQPQQPGVTIAPGGGVAPVMMSTFPLPGMGAANGSEIYRIAPAGSPTRVWSSREDLVYALAFDQRGQLLAGTGNRGHIFAITGEDRFTHLVKASATQVTAFTKAPDGGLYGSTSNLGKVLLLGANPQGEGTYESDVFDAHIFSRWGRLEFRGAGNVDLFVRSGNVDNPDRNWSPWQKVDLKKEEAISAPPARFVQWKAILHGGDPAPFVDSVIVNYLPKNVAPDFDDVTVQTGVRYTSLPQPKPVVTDTSGGTASQPHFDVPPPSTRDSGSIGVRWNVHDDNDDQMAYSVYYRGDGESRWLLLKDNTTDKYYSFDASLLPDGGYTVKVVASDAPSHSPGQALTAEKESARFEVDTTPPRIEDLQAATDGDQIHVTFRAVDSFSNIKRAEYSVDAADWQFVEPVDQIADSKSENYDFRVELPVIPPAAGGDSYHRSGKTKAVPTEHVVVVRVYDRYDNMVSAKTMIGGRQR